MNSLAPDEHGSYIVNQNKYYQIVELHFNDGETLFQLHQIRKDGSSKTMGTMDKEGLYQLYALMNTTIKPRINNKKR